MMNVHNKKEPLLLLLGDVVILFFALWLMLVLRYGDALTRDIFYAHATPFSVLFVVWLCVFFIAGLYEKHTRLLRSRLPKVVVRAEIVNSVLAVLFFYFVPYFGIAPKINLFVYLVISVVLILWWRMYGFGFISTRRKQNAVLIGAGRELYELFTEVNNNPRYALRFVDSIDTSTMSHSDIEGDLVRKIEHEHVTLLVLDVHDRSLDPVLPHLYTLIFKGVQFIDIHKLYEDIFDRIPLSLVQSSWFLHNVSFLPQHGYDMLKRMMDILLALVLGVPSLILYPLIVLLIKFDDGGSVFIYQERVGLRGKRFKTIKFRTWMFDDAGAQKASRKNKQTRVGPFLRRSRLDELPQFLNILRGDLSLIGPRPELPSLVTVYEQKVPYYTVRHLIKPGLSGWAQLYHENHPHHEIDVDETRVKLSYDLYYIKNRSLFLDVKIALKTLKVLLSRSGA